MINFTQTPKRIEIKDVITSSMLCPFEKSLRLCDLGFRQTYPPRKINSLYFDSLSLNSFEESIEGSSERTKLRLRWYGNERSLTPSTFEIKRKVGFFSWKDLYKNQSQVDPDSRKWQNFILIDKKENYLDQIIKSKRPVAIVTYNRKYYSSWNQKIRITIDSNLTTFNQRFSTQPNLRFSRKHLNQIIIEAKVDANDESELHLMHQKLPFSPKRFSKYCESIMPRFENFN